MHKWPTWPMYCTTLLIASTHMCCTAFCLEKRNQTFHKKPFAEIFCGKDLQYGSNDSGQAKRASCTAEEMNDSNSTARHRDLRVLSLSKRSGLRKKTSQVENPGSDTGVPDVIILFPRISRSTPQNFNPLAKLSTSTQKKPRGKVCVLRRSQH